MNKNDKSSEVVFYKLNPIHDLDEIKYKWLNLQERCPHSFFLSWVWIETWLRSVPDDQEINFIYATINDKLFAAYFVGLKKGFDRSLAYCLRGFLNSTGDEQLDEITVEYNGLMLDRTIVSEGVRGLFLQSIAYYDEMICPAVSPEWMDLIQVYDNDKNVQLMMSKPSYYVDLAKVRQYSCNLLPLLSKSKRSQIKRSLRCYEEMGTPVIKVAESEGQALEFLNCLKVFHQERWVKKDGYGSFSNNFFQEFHARLISDCFDKGNINLLKVSCGDEVLGYLYTFLYQSKVYFYQCGLNYRPGNLYRPGLICHYLAINYYAKNGYAIYDFLAGDSDYKKSLSTDLNTLYWFKVRRDKLLFRVDDILRSVKSFVRKLL